MLHYLCSSGCGVTLTTCIGRLLTLVCEDYKRRIALGDIIIIIIINYVYAMVDAINI